MKSFLITILFFCIAVSLTTVAHAQCMSGCLTGFSISPGSVIGDQSDFATAQVQVYIGDPNQTYFPVELQQSGTGSAYVYCEAGQFFGGGCGYPVTQGSNTLQFLVSGYNGSNNTEQATLTVSWDVSLNASLSISAIPSPQEPASSDPNSVGSAPTVI